jgi:hypothetical protein
MDTQEKKPALASFGILGSLATIITGVTQVVLDSGVLHAPITPYVVLGSGLISLFGRIFARKEIKGVVSSK